MTTLSDAEMFAHLRRRAAYLERQVADAELIGRNLTWAKGELLALQRALELLVAKADAAARGAAGA